MDSIRAQLKQAFNDYRRKPDKGQLMLNASSHVLLENTRQAESVQKSAAVALPQFGIQTIFRPLFGKQGITQPDIGDHPDFKYLTGTDDEENHAITTLFMDIAGSTRLGRLYPLSDVKRIKNAFMRIAIEFVQAFDGHVHRLQGDAVMAYFGKRNGSKEQSAIDAINAASMICYFAEKVVVPGLQEEGYEDPPGIRLGVDYGADENVLWSSYGYPGTQEVTATSYYVDVAAKLQHKAGKNQIMIGASIKDFLDLPTELLSVRTFQEGGQKREEPFVLPNYTDADGKPFNYRQYVFESDQYLLHTPVGQGDREYFKGPQANGVMRVTAEAFSSRTSAIGAPVMPASSILKKGYSLRFRIVLPYMPKLPYTVRFIVENHGAEAKADGGENCGNHETPLTISTQSQHENLVHWEDLEYRGLHYMIVRVSTAAGINHETRFGVFVE